MRMWGSSLRIKCRPQGKQLIGEDGLRSQEGRHLPCPGWVHRREKVTRDNGLQGWSVPVAVRTAGDRALSLAGVVSPSV